MVVPMPYGPASNSARMLAHVVTQAAACPVLPKQSPPAEFPPVHHRPAPRRLPRLLWPSGAADATYRFDRGAGTAFDQLLCRKPGLPAEPRQPDDRPHAVGAWRALQRHSAVMDAVTFVDLLARRRLRHRADRQEPFAELHPPARSSSGRCRATAITSRRRSCARRCATISPTRNTSRRRRSIGREPGAHVQTPFYGFDHVDAGARPWRRNRRRLRPLVERATPRR